MSGEEIPVAQVVAQALVEAGVTHVFGGHGGAVIPLINAITQCEGLTWIYTRNENNASLAAAGAAKLTGKLSCCVATAGPGASNLTTGLIDAALDRVPVLAITGMRARWDLGHTEFQDIDQAGLFRSAGITFSHVVMHSLEAIPLLRNAIRHAIAHHTVAHLAIPVDIQSKLVTPAPKLPSFSVEHHSIFAAPINAPTLPEPHELDAAASTLSGSSKRIVICVGPRAALHQCGSSILELAETLNAPILSTLDAKGCVDEGHPLYFGVLGIFGNPGMEVARTVVSSSDLLVLIGMSLASDFLLSSDKVQTRMVVSIDSDYSAASISNWYHAEHKLVGNMGDIALELAKRLPHTPPKTTSLPTLPQSQQSGAYWDFFHKGGWRQLIDSADVARPWDLRITVDKQCSSGYCHPGKVLAEVGQRMKKDDVVVVDTGDITLWTSLCMCLRNGTRLISSQAMGTMGYALPAGIASALIRPHSRVVVVAGDGGIQMSIGELSLVSQYNVSNVTVIISKNTVLGRVHFGWEGVKGDQIDSPDYVLLAKAYGGNGVHVNDPSQIKDAVDQAMNYDKGVFVIEICVDPSLKAEMAKIKDTAALQKITRPFAHKLWPSDLQRLQELVGQELGHIDMLSKEEYNDAAEILSGFLGGTTGQKLLDLLHSGDWYGAQTAKPLMAPLEGRDSPFAITVVKGEDNKGTVLHDIGAVKFVLQGDVPTDVLSKTVHASKYIAGFELGTIKGPHAPSLSDMVVVNDRAFMNSAERDSPDWGHLLCGPDLNTTCGIFLPKESIPDFSVKFTSKPLEWNRVVNDIYSRADGPLFFCGLVQFSSLEGQALTKPPIYGEDLLAQASKYYDGIPDCVQKDTWVYVTGLATRYTGISPELEKKLGRHLYDIKAFEDSVAGRQNKSEEPASPQSHYVVQLSNAINKLRSKLDRPMLNHTHGVVLLRSISSAKDILPEVVSRVIHLRGNSKCSSASLDVYLVKDIEPAC